ncbi:T-cell immunoglobulin and mucin domain-containing protein 4 [Eulemur rufifrons]|uniref:T-cell immunoglobulin and mucin domain-containing protein 4 n=1 Tax=Eulemur rufifrons TaxID=859984 RepID=UPI003744B1A9
MCKGLLVFWLLIEFGRLYLTPAAAEIVVTAYLGEPVTLPCLYASWSQYNSMCWGKGQCPNSRCKQELISTDGTKVISWKSPKYSLQGDIRRGQVSLTISSLSEDDSGVYCCRIEVPGWFNDVKTNVRLLLKRAPTTTLRTTTMLPTTTSHVMTTTSHVTTTTAVLSTTVVATPDLTTRTPFQTSTTAALTTAANTCPLTTPSSLPEAATEGPFLTAESETVLLTSDSRGSTESTSDAGLLTSKETEVSTSQDAWVWKMRDSITAPQPRESETTTAQNETGVQESVMGTPNFNNLVIIIASSLGFVLLALLLTFLLRGKVMETNCSQKHSRLDNAGECKSVLSDMQHGREDEDGLFTL